jgi:hypothetical protein
MKTFTEEELRLIDRLRKAPAQTTLELREPCPTHSVCTPLPLFRVYRSSDGAFEAEWNSHHKKGPKQTFLFADLPPRSG